jgi:hypothetical protein
MTLQSWDTKLMMALAIELFYGFGVISIPEKPNNKHQHPSSTTRLTISRWRNRGNANPSLKKFYVRLSSLIAES